MRISRSSGSVEGVMGDHDTYSDNSFLCLLETVFVDPVSVEIAFGDVAVTATSAVKRLVAGVVEGSLARLDFRLAVGLGASMMPASLLELSGGNIVS
jgi:hypothetical protein